MPATFDVRYDGVNLPDIVTLGMRQRITDRFRVMAGAEWSNWSRFDTVEIKGGPRRSICPSTTMTAGSSRSAASST